jgi:hypothetical protein
MAARHYAFSVVSSKLAASAGIDALINYNMLPEEVDWALRGDHFDDFKQQCAQSHLMGARQRQSGQTAVM